MNASPSPEVIADAPPIAEGSSSPRASRGRRLVEWFWRSRALAEASSSDDAGAAPEYLALVEESVEIADRLSARIDPPQRGSGFGPAIALYRDALSAALLSLGASPSSPPDDALLERLVSRSGGPEAVAAARALLGRDVASIGRLTEGERRNEAARARSLLHEAIDVLAGAHRRRRRVLAQRLFRSTLLVIVIAALCAGGVAFVLRLTRHPNFLERATMRTSSTYPGFSPTDGVCDGRKTKIIFHTNREDQPWVEFEMAAPRMVSNVELVNRRDCCEDRALPLAVEVSPDGKVWREVLHRTEPFGELRQKIAPTTVRLVRVRALKKTWFHLERVAVW